MPETRISFIPNHFYHVYNHGNGDDNIFREPENYRYFLQKYAQHLNAITETYAYCLLPNHFHLMIRVKPVESLIKAFQEKYPAHSLSNFRSFENFEGFIMQQFKNFLNSYTKAYNKRYNRKGYLFRQNLKRKPIVSEGYYTKIIQYIHLNPVGHGFVKEPHQWPHSSYNSFLSEKITLLKREEVLGWFGGAKAFREFHRTEPLIVLNLRGF